MIRDTLNEVYSDWRRKARCENFRQKLVHCRSKGEINLLRPPKPLWKKTGRLLKFIAFSVHIVVLRVKEVR